MNEKKYFLLLSGLTLLMSSCQQQGSAMNGKNNGMVPHSRSFEEVRKDLGLSPTTLPSTFQVQQGLDKILSGPVSKECGRDEVEDFEEEFDDSPVLADNKVMLKKEEEAPTAEELAAMSRSRAGCESLYTVVMIKKTDDLMKCYQSLKAAVIEDAFVSCTRDMNQTSPCLDRKKVFSNMYTKLSKEEQSFLSMTMTAQGEAGVLAPPIEEMMMVMKVLKNRKDYAQNRGIPYKDVNELDVALQPWQFSMYNSNDPNWSRVLKSSPRTNKHVQYAVEAFVQFENSSFTPASVFDDVWHYHTNYIARPNWSTPSREVNDTIEVNGKHPKNSNPRHLFLQNVPWSFAYNDFRPRN